MKLVGRALAALLVATLAFAILSWTVESTLANPKYMDRQAERTQLYTNLGLAIPATSPEIVRLQVQALLTQINAYLLKGGPAPTIDFGTTSVTLGVTDQPLPAATFITPASKLAPFVIGMLVLLIVVVRRGQSPGALSRVCFGTATCVAVGAAFIWGVSLILLQGLSHPDFTAIHTAIGPYVKLVFNDIALRLLAYSAALLVVGGGLWVLQRTGQAILRRLSQPDIKTETATPFPQ